MFEDIIKIVSEAGIFAHARDPIVRERKIFDAAWSLWGILKKSVPSQLMDRIEESWKELDSLGRSERRTGIRAEEADYLRMRVRFEALWSACERHLPKEFSRVVVPSVYALYLIAHHSMVAARSRRKIAEWYESDGWQCPACGTENPPHLLSCLDCCEASAPSRIILNAAGVLNSIRVDLLSKAIPMTAVSADQEPR